MSVDLRKRLLSGSQDPKNRRIILLVLGIVIFGVVLVCADGLQSAKKIEPAIERKTYGKGTFTEELDIRIGEDDAGKKEKIRSKVEISERQYTRKEVQDLFDRIIRRMDRMIQGENASLEHVDHDLNLITEVPGEPVKIRWMLDRYDVMNSRGELQEAKIKEEGVAVNITAVLTYTEDEKRQKIHHFCVPVYPKVMTGPQKRIKEVKERLKAANKADPTGSLVRLPEEVNGRELTYYRPFQYRGIVVIVMGILVGGLLIALQKQNQVKEQDERKKQMLRDYPEIINKLTLYLGAGMTVKRAWRNVVEAYAKDSRTEKRYAYEEMKKTCYEMDSGMTEAQSYENFGRRCEVQVYIRLGALLSQNLRKGTKGLTQLLKMEAVQAFEDRKAQAKRLGEEAGTKLLLPMFLMLAVVLVIVIVPAFFSMQI